MMLCYICNNYKCINCLKSYYIFSKSTYAYKINFCHLCCNIVHKLEYANKIIKSSFKLKRSVLFVYNQPFKPRILKIIFIL